MLAASPSLRAPSPVARAARPQLAGARARLSLRAAAAGEEDDGAKSMGVLSRDNPELLERFAVIGSGEAECKSCQYTYSPKQGDPNYPVSKGTLFENLPEDWRCPTCGSEKSLFVSKATKVAGFSQNQGYGLGSNGMTGEQKSLLIYGSLTFFFAMFIAGYLLD